MAEWLLRYERVVFAMFYGALRFARARRVYRDDGAALRKRVKQNVMPVVAAARCGSSLLCAAQGLALRRPPEEMVAVPPESRKEIRRRRLRAHR